MKYPALLLAAAWLASTGDASAKAYCGELQNSFGPFDYRTAQPKEKKLVEGAHFTEDVRLGIKGVTGQIGADLDYTLRAFPNHPRGLATLTLLAARTPGKAVGGMRYPVECWFERAVRFQPDDANTWALYATYLYNNGKDERAFAMLQKAAELDPENPSINYNLGLAYAKQKQYEQALPYAHKAYRQEFPLLALKQMLVAAGQWREPPPAPLPDAEQPDAEPPAAAAPSKQP